MGRVPVQPMKHCWPFLQQIFLVPLRRHTYFRVLVLHDMHGLSDDGSLSTNPTPIFSRAKLDMTPIDRAEHRGQGQYANYIQYSSLRPLWLVLYTKEHELR
jgi:hypothetical protein